MRRYSVQLNAVSVTAAKTLIRVTAPSTMVLVVLRAWISQANNTTLAMARATIHRVTTDGTGTAETPEKLESGDPAASFTAAVNLTAEPTLSGDPIIDEGFNIINGWLYVPAPEERIWVPPSGRIALRLPTIGSASMFTAGMILGEVG